MQMVMNISATLKMERKNGKGIFKWNDGCMYYGEYKDNKMDGFGSCYNSSGVLIYEGQWKQIKSTEQVLTYGAIVKNT